MCSLTISNIFILDLIYHKTTVFFMRNLSILTIGPLAVNMDYKDLDIVVPISNDNITSQAFFLYILLFYRRLSELNNYTNTLVV